MHNSYDDKRTRILNEARTLFARFGFRKCTTQDIASACGLTKAALYHYFANKEELFTEVVKRETQQLITAVQQAIETSDDPLTQLYAYNVTKAEKIKDLLNLYRISYDTSLDFAPMIEEARQEYFTQERKILEAILEEGIRRGKFKPLPVSLAAKSAIAAFKGLEIHLFPEDPEALTAAITGFLDILAYGLVQD